MREFFCGASVTEVVDNWDSTGLRGTASHDYAVSDVFVPILADSLVPGPPREV